MAESPPVPYRYLLGPGGPAKEHLRRSRPSSGLDLDFPFPCRREAAASCACDEGSAAAALRSRLASCASC